MAACELIIKMRPDAIFDTDKMVRSAGTCTLGYIACNTPMHQRGKHIPYIHLHVHAHTHTYTLMNRVTPHSTTQLPVVVWTCVHSSLTSVPTPVRGTRRVCLLSTTPGERSWTMSLPYSPAMGQLWQTLPGLQGQKSSAASTHTHKYNSKVAASASWLCNGN